MFSRAGGHLSSAIGFSAAAPVAIGGLSHVAIAVPPTTPLRSAAEIYTTMAGAQLGEPHELATHGVTSLIVELPNTRLELLHPLGSASPLRGFLQRFPGGGMHHVCLYVSDMAQAVERCRALGVRTLTDRPRPGAHGRPVIFLHPKDCGGVLIELEQAYQIVCDDSH